MSPTYKVGVPFYVPGQARESRRQCGLSVEGLNVQSYFFCGVESFKPSHDKKRKF